jgi:hypothetical protein
MAFLKTKGINLLSLVFADGSNSFNVIRSEHHHLHHK